MRNDLSTTKELVTKKAANSSVLHAGHELGFVVTRRPEALRKRRRGVTMNARGPEICKAWNLSDIEAETVHSQPARGLY